LLIRIYVIKIERVCMSGNVILRWPLLAGGLRWVYAPRLLLRSEKYDTDRRTDIEEPTSLLEFGESICYFTYTATQTVTLRLPLEAASEMPVSILYRFILYVSITLVLTLSRNNTYMYDRGGSSY